MNVKTLEKKGKEKDCLRGYWDEKDLTSSWYLIMNGSDHGFEMRY